MCRPLFEDRFIDTARIDVFRVDLPSFLHHATVTLYVPHSRFEHLTQAVRKATGHKGSLFFFTSAALNERAVFLSSANDAETRFASLTCAMYP